MTKREAILRALKLKLVGLTGVPDASVYRSRVVPYTRGECPAVAIEPVSDSPDNQTVPMLDWRMLVRVTVFVRGAEPDMIADPIVESIHSKLMADQSLSGLLIDLQPGPVTFELLEGDQPVGVITLDFRVQYRTSATDLSS